MRTQVLRIVSSAAALLGVLLLAGSARAAEPPTAAPAPAVPAPAPAGPPAPLSFTSRVEPAEVALGQPFTWVIEIVHEAGVSYAAPRQPAVGTLGVRGVKASTAHEPGKDRTTLRIELAVYDHLGALTLPDLALDVSSPAGKGTLSIPGPSVNVTGAVTDQQLAPPHPPRERTLPSLRLLWIGIGVLAAAGLAFLAVRWLRSLRRQSESLHAAPAGTPEDRARGALEALQVEALVLQGRTREHYFRLSEIVRRYLEEVTPVRALDMTTAEVVDALARRPPPGLDLARFGAWLERGDLVRFARAEVGPREAGAELDEARSLIDAMAAARRPVPQETAA